MRWAFEITRERDELKSEHRRLEQERDALKDGNRETWRELDRVRNQITFVQSVNDTGGDKHDLIDQNSQI